MSIKVYLFFFFFFFVSPFFGRGLGGSHSVNTRGETGLYLVGTDVALEGGEVGCGDLAVAVDAASDATQACKKTGETGSRFRFNLNLRSAV